MDCDIIGFQEVFSADALKNLVQALDFKYFEIVDIPKLCPNNKDTYISTTVAIASKYPISNIQEVTSNLCTFARIPIKATILLPNEQELLVYVCHLKSNRLNELEHTFTKHHSLEYKKELVLKDFENNYCVALKQRICEASALFLDIKSSKDKPTILLCDLNDKEFSITIDALSNSKYHDKKSKENFILYDAFYQYKEEIQRKATSYFVAKGNVLDYIFISNDFIKTNKNKIAKVTNYTIFDEHLKQNKNGSLVTSDHASVVCELTFI